MTRSVRVNLTVCCVLLVATGALTAFRPSAVPPFRRSAVPPSVRPGIDVLLTDSARLIAGRRVGLITNQSGIDARGVSSIDRLWAAAQGRDSAATFSPQSTVPSPRLVSLFAPEHGIRGAARPGETVADTSDSATGLPIYSLYGANRAPTAAQMADLDVLVVDLQDVGARTYTYTSTMVYALRAAKAAGKRVLVLDRPNPIGCAMEGPVLDTAYTSFIGPLPVPLRHGLTMGEMARFANAELRIGADLVVVPVQGWRRCMWFDETGLPWVRPSPNLPDLEAVSWYPGTVLFEATNLSVGRGTDAGFKQIGAPWLDVSAAMNLARFLNLAGVARTTFTPRAPGDGKYADRELQGLRLGPMDRNRSRPVAAALILMEALLDTNDSMTVDTLGLWRRLGRRYLVQRHDPKECDDCLHVPTWSSEISAFRRKVGRYLLYR